jgi:hypothetical protein
MDDTGYGTRRCSFFGYGAVYIGLLWSKEGLSFLTICLLNSLDDPPANRQE